MNFSCMNTKCGMVFDRPAKDRRCPGCGSGFWVGTRWAGSFDGKARPSRWTGPKLGGVSAPMSGRQRDGARSAACAVDAVNRATSNRMTRAEAIAAARRRKRSSTDATASPGGA